MVEMAMFICSLHAEGPETSYVSKDQVGMKMAPLKCPSCGAFMHFNGFKEMN